MSRDVGVAEGDLGTMGLVGLVTWMATASAADVSLSHARWLELSGFEEAPAVRDPGPRATRRRVTLSPDDDGIRVAATWQLDAVEPGWFAVPVVGPGVAVDRLTWRGRPASATAGPQGATVTLWVDGPGELALVGTHAGDPSRGDVPLGLLPAARGAVEVTGPWALSGDGVANLGDGRYAATARALSLTRQRDARAQTTLATASVGVGITVSDSEARVQGRVVWQVARGALPSVVFDAPGAGADLEVTGPLVASWDRQGDRVTVALRDDRAARIALEVRWSTAVPSGEATSMPAPRLMPQGAFRTNYALQVARDGEVEVVPRAADDGWQTKAAAELPAWGRGLVQGTPTAAYTAGSGAPGGPTSRLDLYRFTPVSQPPTLVDVQQITAALSDEGRVLMRVSYAVRNDRGAFLRVEPPAGTTILGAVVAGDTADPARDGDAWLLPLKKSVETVQGLLSFPVQLVVVGELDAWQRREECTLPLPVVDAEVAVSQVTVHLPPGFRPTHKDDEHGTVAGFSEGEGITYGFAVGDTRAAEADRRFQEAVQAWMGNEFDQAQELLDELSTMGASNENVVRLQSNLDLLDGKGGGGGSVALERRVKDQAKARSLDDAREQAQVLEEADNYAIAGDYDKAEAAYSQALELGEKLSKLDQAEDRGNSYRNEAVKQKLAETQSMKKAKRRNSTAAYQEEEARKAEASAQEAERRRMEAEAEANRAWAQRDRERAESNQPMVELRRDRIVLSDDPVAAFDPSYDRSQHLPPPIPVDASTFAPDEVTGVVGGVEGGVVGGVVGGVLGGVVANGEVEFSDELIEGELVSPDATELVYSDAEVVVEARRGPRVRLPKVKVGGRSSKAEPPPPPPPPPMAPPSASPVTAAPAPAPAEQPPAQTESAATGQVVTKEFLTRIPAGRSYQAAVSLSPGVAAGGKESRRERKEARREEEARQERLSTFRDAAPRDDASGFVEIDMNDDEDVDYLAAPEPVEEQEEEWVDGEQVFERAKVVHETRASRRPVVQEVEPLIARKREKKKKKADKASGKAELRAAIDQPEITIMMGSDDELPDVKATSLDVIVPAQGAPVRYQRHLVPAGAPQSVRLEARRTRRKP